MKKLFIILAILFIVFLIAFVSCKKVNILSPTRIPNPARKISISKDIVNRDIEISPKNLLSGEVFGGFERKFRYKDKWYIMASYKYYYDKDTKELREAANNVILELSDDGQIKVYHENTDYYTWYRLRYQMNVIETDKVSYEDPRYSDLELGYTPYYFINDKNELEWYYVYDKITVNDLIYYSENLINWKTNGSGTNLWRKLPDIKTGSFQDNFGAEFYCILFDDYIHLLGLEESFLEQNPSGARNENLGPYLVSKDKYYRIHKDNDGDTGAYANWKEFNAPWGKLSGSFITVKFDDKMAFEAYEAWWCMTNDKGEYLYTNYDDGSHKWQLESKASATSGIWVSSDGINWHKNTDPNVQQRFDSYTGVSDEKGRAYKHKNSETVPIREKTPEEPSWIKEDDKYYRVASEYKIYDGYYQVPIPPIKEIEEAVNRGDKYFNVTEEHIKNAGLNQFMLSTVNPTNAAEDDWKLIATSKYSGDNMVWQMGGDNMLFNVNGKTILLADYYKLKDIQYSKYAYTSYVIPELRNKAKSYRNTDDYYEAMYHEAQADMLEKIFQDDNLDLIKPKEAISHYEIEFK